ncbi:MAG: response regulator transcription factor [Acidobacteria bacterium]|nr:response regulator transcription factor [Acidobacteriota bacterium]
MRVLIVEDDQKAAGILKRGLEEEAFSVDLANDGGAAEQAAAAVDYDVIILDWLLPGKQGIDICRELRLRGMSVPILMLTAKDALEDRVAGLNTGADDYLTKPFAFWELVARIRALVRRARSARSPLLKVADLTLDPVTHVVTRGGQPVSLTVKEYAILHVLAQHAGRVVSRAQLAECLWHDDLNNVINLVDVYISRLRKKIDDGAEVPLVRTVRGRGYRLAAEAE